MVTSGGATVAEGSVTPGVGDADAAPEASEIPKAEPPRASNPAVAVANLVLAFMMCSFELAVLTR
jgi:hypothetical protein